MKTTEELFKIGGFGIQEIDAIFKDCLDGIVIKNSRLNYVSANASYCKLFGISDFSELIKNGVNMYLPEISRTLINDADNEIRKNLHPINYILNIGRNKIVSISSSPIISSENFCGIISIIRDITQEEALKENFVNKHFEYINNQKQLQSQRETFVASIGHDLKNPTLAQIRSLELLLKGSFGTFNTEQKEILDMILDSCRYMNGMLSSLLATYRNYGGAIKLNFEYFDLSELLTECVSEMVYVAKDKDIKIINNNNLATEIYADKIQIKRVLMNLLSNGIKYAFKNTELKLILEKDNTYVSFRFENSSPYITEDKQKSIFAKYVSYSGINKELGIGLGLYASKKIINSHDGEMFVQSFQDNKNIFGFKIPIHQNSKFEKEILF